MIEESSTLCNPPEVVNLDEEPPPPKRKGRLSAMLDLDKEPLDWWKQQRMTFPYLSQLIKKLHCITATSCPSEGNLVNNKRNCLLPENVDRMLFLYENLNDQPLQALDEDNGDSEEDVPIL